MYHHSKIPEKMSPPTNKHGHANIHIKSTIPITNPAAPAHKNTHKKKADHRDVDKTLPYIGTSIKRASSTKAKNRVGHMFGPLINGNIPVAHWLLTRARLTDVKMPKGKAQLARGLPLRDHRRLAARLCCCRPPSNWPQARLIAE